MLEALTEDDVKQIVKLFHGLPRNHPKRPTTAEHYRQIETVCNILGITTFPAKLKPSDISRIPDESTRDRLQNTLCCAIHSIASPRVADYLTVNRRCKPGDVFDGRKGKFKVVNINKKGKISYVCETTAKEFKEWASVMLHYMV